jgi:hypothetical protein
MPTVDELIQLQPEAKQLEAKLQQAKLDKASEYLSSALLEIQTRIQIAKSNRR